MHIFGKLRSDRVAYVGYSSLRPGKKTNMRYRHLFTAAILGLFVSSSIAVAADNPAEKVQASIDKGLAYLKTKQQPEGGWETPTDPPAITALVLKAFMLEPQYAADQPFLAKGFDRLLSYQKPDGGIFRDTIANYNTAIAISALASSKKYEPAIDKAVAFLRKLQWSDNIDQLPDRVAVKKGDDRYGGFGYGGKARPDGSNLQFAIDALHDAGVKPGDPAYQAAIVFASRLQNRSESNDQKWAGNDGGFIYTDFDGGASSAGSFTDADGQKRFNSYGTMTYAGLKSMIYAGLSKDDPRVKAAWSWITKNWTFDEIPGLKLGANKTNNADTGMFYFCYTAARALSAYGEPIVTDAQGKKHDWRVEIIARLTAKQNPDGSWTGEKRWMESNPMVATPLALLALEEAKADLKAHPGA
jgi:squalene-hopene/tetraprenyl-beta-curcumene cyclase